MTTGGGLDARRGRPDTSAIGVLIAVVIAAVLGVLLVGGPDEAATAADPAVSDATDASPLTGEPGAGDAVLAVKVDNAPVARPWDGVEDADVVYVEPIEGGSTRLLAVFASRLPESVGPVRSVRETDLGILAAYGGPALAYSGGAPELDGRLADSGVVGIPQRAAPDAFRREPGRPAPHDLFADPAALRDAAPEAAPPQDIGFRFGDAPAGGTPVEEVTETVGAVRVGLRWDGERWAVSFDGRPASAGDGPATAATVVVQRVEVTSSGIRDAAGNPSPTAGTVGSGAVDVLRDGQRITGTWSRPDPGSPTLFTDASGGPLRFAPGPVWVLLVRA